MEQEKFQELVLQQFKVFSEQFKKIDERFEQIDRRFEQIDQRFEQIDRRLEQNDQRFEQIDSRLTRLEQTTVRIENDHGEKLAALLDGYKQNAEILADHTKRLERIEAQLQTHDIQIQILDKTKSNKRRTKAK